MSDTNPLHKKKEDFKEIIDRISSEQSAVGIDAQYTHAIIIEYLNKLSERLDRIEQKLDQQ